ncbi:hypothetical protein CAPTEDRAFT_196035 [Capitella teleta]|uniref:PX domain-containing protein n=1 Tax=Capitella teleta TaxID=283909 RepID=R7U1U5_CAPTE|nr:hypothetical protein CAPTEDRAFT_196035 [Capitella teleta]|eukprot:ELT97155.1 hypothetical protein CAPTEDRAFT_196035 [Capitella teleta]
MAYRLAVDYVECQLYSITSDNELKNKETGLDLNIASHREVKGLFNKSVHYQMVAVSQLPCFKSPKHKESDVVQFMIEKQYDDFVSLRGELACKFPSLQLPPLPSSLLDFTKSNVADRKGLVEEFLSAIAASKQLAICHLTLEFLGVNSLSSGKYTSNDGGVSRLGAKSLDSAGLFDDDATKKGDLFASAAEEAEDEDLFSLKKSPKKQEVLFGEGDNRGDLIFGHQDLGGAVDEDEEEMFLVPGAKDLPDLSALKLEDNSEILNINDDDVENLRAKPKLKPKPSLPSKPKPALKPKPKSVSTDSHSTLNADMGHTDILQYIQQNAQSANDDDDDLFT